MMMIDSFSGANGRQRCRIDRVSWWIAQLLQRRRFAPVTIETSPVTANQGPRFSSEIVIQPFEDALADKLSLFSFLSAFFPHITKPRATEEACFTLVRGLAHWSERNSRKGKRDVAYAAYRGKRDEEDSRLRIRHGSSVPQWVLRLWEARLQLAAAFLVDAMACLRDAKVGWMIAELFCKRRSARR